MAAILRTIPVTVALAACNWMTPRSIEGLPCDSAGACTDGYVCDRGTSICVDAASCADGDGDGACAASDCDDANPRCIAAGCTDADGDGWCVDFDCYDGPGGAGCTDACVDADHDGLPTCGGDCDDSAADCLFDCGANVDPDPGPDCADRCVDADQDGWGRGINGNTSCPRGTANDRDDDDPDLCADTDGDGCDDCSQGGGFDPSADGADADGDGICDLTDPCTDADRDGVGRGDNGNSGCLIRANDTDDGDDRLCSDVDDDSCDDCAVARLHSPGNDGPDDDGDGKCDAGDPFRGDPTRCGDLEPDGCDDCSRGSFAPDNDGVDADGDGWCAGPSGDCDDAIAACTTGPACTTDADNDGLVACADCHDLVPGCRSDCSNSDADANPDCLEVACGTDPAAADVCLLADGRSVTVAQAIGIANGSPVFDHVLIAYPAVFGTGGGSEMPMQVLSSGDGECMSIRATVPLSVVDSITAFRALEPGCVIERMAITGGVNTIDMRSPAGVVRDCDLSDFTDGAAIRIDGPDALIAGNFIHDGSNGDGDDRAGILVLGNGDNARIVGNVVVNNESDGIQLRNQPGGVTIDHNTIANNGQPNQQSNSDGIDVRTNTAADLCLRNNIVSHNRGAALRIVSAVTWETTRCTAPLTPAGAPAYGNANFANGGGVCPSNCGGAPSTLWEFTSDPQYGPGSTSERTAYCISQADLIDSGDDLGADMNGPAAGTFNGGGPEIGALERGTALCP